MPLLDTNPPEKHTDSVGVFGYIISHDHLCHTAEQLWVDNERFQAGPRKINYDHTPEIGQLLLNINSGYGHDETQTSTQAPPTNRSLDGAPSTDDIRTEAGTGDPSPTPVPSDYLTPADDPKSRTTVFDSRRSILPTKEGKQNLSHLWWGL
ncbi:hypothetical protein BJY01DRAFT_175732 [Aspergillus pseudoustus]|uniref:Uncharacterized protein n=1 Tax=Aspergillus pseudoustus TaxID=1810923 RepID=A0ABR4K4L2_9EURO